MTDLNAHEDDDWLPWTAANDTPQTAQGIPLRQLPLLLIRRAWWRVLLMPWLDCVRRAQGRWTTRDWLDWTVEQAAPYGLQREVREDFWRDALRGEHPSIAAQDALYEWEL